MLLQFLRFAVGAIMVVVLVGAAASDIACAVARQVRAVPDEHVVETHRPDCAYLRHGQALRHLTSEKIAL